MATDDQGLSDPMVWFPVKYWMLEGMNDESDQGEGILTKPSRRWTQ